jgi:hypothetical protein
MVHGYNNRPHIENNRFEILSQKRLRPPNAAERRTPNAKRLSPSELKNSQSPDRDHNSRSGNLNYHHQLLRAGHNPLMSFGDDPDVW